MKLIDSLLLVIATTCALAAKAGDTQSWGRVSNALAVGLPLVAAGNAYAKGDTEGFKRYLRSAGEAEARATQARRNMSMEERRKLFPLRSYDVPIKDLLFNK